jgi:HAD superfamily hydrolase (TIGR01509 family)
VIEAVIFDLDGVLLQTEELWDEVRERYVRERGGRYDAAAQRAMMGMSSLEWSQFIHGELGVDEAPETISREVAELLEERYRVELPLIHGAEAAVRRLAARWPLALASSSNRSLIDAALSLSGLASLFRVTVSSEEVPRGKPAPDVYLEAARRLGVPAVRCAAVEDSHSGIRSAAAAGMRVLAIPNPSYPPDEEALAGANVVLGSLGELTVSVVDASR